MGWGKFENAIVAGVATASSCYRFPFRLGTKGGAQLVLLGGMHVWVDCGKER